MHLIFTQSLHIKCKLIQIIPTKQPNRILIHKPIHFRLVIPKEVVMQPCLTVGILVLQAERLVSTIRYLSFLFQTTPAGIVAELQEVAVLIGHLSWNANLVAVVVVGLLAAFSVFVGPVAYLRQRSVAVLVGVDIDISAVRLDFLR